MKTIRSIIIQKYGIDNLISFINMKVSHKLRHNLRKKDEKFKNFTIEVFEFQNVRLINEFGYSILFVTSKNGLVIDNPTYQFIFEFLKNFLNETDYNIILNKYIEFASEIKTQILNNLNTLINFSEKEVIDTTVLNFDEFDKLYKKLKS